MRQPPPPLLPAPCMSQCAGPDEPSPRGKRLFGVGAKLSVRERREQRDAWHAEHVVHRAAHLAAVEAAAVAKAEAAGASGGRSGGPAVPAAAPAPGAAPPLLLRGPHMHGSHPCRGVCAHARSGSPKPAPVPGGGDGAASAELRALLDSTTTTAGADAAGGQHRTRRGSKGGGRVNGGRGSWP